MNGKLFSVLHEWASSFGKGKVSNTFAIAANVVYVNDPGVGEILRENIRVSVYSKHITASYNHSTPAPLALPSVFSQP